MVMAGGALVFVCGLWLVGLGDFSFGDGWISAALGLFLVALGLGALGGQRPKQARLLATRLAGEGRPASPELRELLDDGRSIGGQLPRGGDRGGDPRPDGVQAVTPGHAGGLSRACRSASRAPDPGAG